MLITGLCLVVASQIMLGSVMTFIAPSLMQSYLALACILLFLFCIIGEATTRHRPVISIVRRGKRLTAQIPTIAATTETTPLPMVAAIDALVPSPVCLRMIGV